MKVRIVHIQRVYAFATQSTSSGEIRLCFNNPVDTTVATIENAQFSGVYTNDSIKAYIDKAKHTFDIAVYNHSDNMIAQLLMMLRKRELELGI